MGGGGGFIWIRRPRSRGWKKFERGGVLENWTILMDVICVLYLETVIVGNLNKNSSEEDLNRLFGLQSTTYLKDNCYVKITLSK